MYFFMFMHFLSNPHNAKIYYSNCLFTGNFVILYLNYGHYKTFYH
jgi:hypothetical protein